MGRTEKTDLPVYQPRHPHSHLGRKKEIDDRLLAIMAEQLHLSRQQLDDLVDCRLGEQGLLARSEEAGVTTTDTLRRGACASERRSFSMQNRKMADGNEDAYPEKRRLHTRAQSPARAGLRYGSTGRKKPCPSSLTADPDGHILFHAEQG
ncbi:hypothetical protein FGU65_12425 [Methanoculleus sp. FWC-SCC1]|uniref:Uncharacterized protein n=1 Tax=Methanoculleus frigidifontis TaxID=2584085 RepID=A0ABT8MCL1_9EURY|nr:hypothetical protein [Methanoculleus sp. FWC-SCC1]MDN7025680.1 hypothetical protein [Methanoculleus sp. FWC-SCC1]